MNLPASAPPIPSSGLSAAVFTAMESSAAMASVAKALGVGHVELALALRRVDMVVAQSAAVDVLSRLITNPLIAGSEVFVDRDINGANAVDLVVHLRSAALEAVSQCGIDVEASVIRSESEDGFWSNEDGWGDLDQATAFYAFEQDALSLPTVGMPAGDVTWVPLKPLYDAYTDPDAVVETVAVSDSPTA